jgi:hypothetical protein
MKTAWSTCRDLATLFCMEASRARVSTLLSRLVAAWMVYMASSCMSRKNQVKDVRVDAMSCVGPRYPYFVVFIVLGRRDSLVF